MTTNNTLLLAGDIGGTKTTLAIYNQENWPGPPLKIQTFSNRKSTDLRSLVAEFLDGESVAPSLACFGAAGPIRQNKVQLTNLDWDIDAQQIQQSFDFQQVHLINDLVATGLGAILLPNSELHPLNKGIPQQEGAIGVLAPGTGLGEAFILYQDKKYRPAPSEGGHATFAPRTPLQIELLQYMLNFHDHVSVEHVCAGIAIPDLFIFMQQHYLTPEWLQQNIDQAADKTPVIIQAAMASPENSQPSEIAIKTLELFTDILADEAANLALKTLSYGGLFLGGGIPPRILPFLTPKRFMPVFCRGVFQEMLADIPIHIVLNSQAALLGAASYGFSRRQ